MGATERILLVASVVLLFARGSAAEPPGRCSFLRASPAGDGTFQVVATYMGQGGRYASAVAPGPARGSERLYVSYLYMSDTFEVASVDPDTGKFEVIGNPIAGEYGARAMATGPDGNVYLGTLPTAHLVKLATATGNLIDLGKPAPGEEFIWSVTFGSDRRLYGTTSPNAKLVRYDPAAHRIEDLGRMDPEQHYARYVAASNDGFVYVGLGSARMNVVAYRIDTKERRDVLPDAYRGPGFAEVYKGTDGKVYALAGAQRLRLDGWVATPIDAPAAAPGIPVTTLKDGRTLKLDERSLSVTDAKGGAAAAKSHAYTYPGRPLPVFSLTAGPGERIYASSILPARLLSLEPRDGTLRELGYLGDGEVYRFGTAGDRLLMAAYACAAPLMAYDPALPFQAKGAAAPNPTLVTYPGGDPGWRPLAFVSGPDGRAYVGGLPGYGKLGGRLVRWDVPAGAVEEYPVLPDGSVSALAVWGPYLVGGTTVKGGVGTTPTRKDVTVFLWDTRTQALASPPISLPFPANSVEHMVVAGDRAYGIADHRMFVFNPSTRAIEKLSELPFAGGTLIGGFDLGPDGRIWGVAPAAKGGGVFAIDPGTNEICLVARPPEPITGGFAIRGRSLYFSSGARIYRYVIPETAPGR